MAVFQFTCKCGAKLLMVGKVRPVCRECGKQMRLGGKVGGPVMYAYIDSFNRTHGSSRAVPHE